MKNTIVLLLSLFSFSLLWGQDTELHQELEQIYKQHITAWVSADKANLEPTLAESFFAVQSGIAFPKDSMLKYVSVRPKSTINSVETKLELDNGHTAYLSVKFVEGSTEGEDQSGVLALATFAREGGAWKVVHSNYELVPVWQAKEMKDDELAELSKMKCSKEKELVSTQNTTDAFIRFKNNSEEKLEICWITFEGERRKYTEIEPGKSWDCRTYMTHPWIIIGKDESCKGIYMPTLKPGMVSID